MAALGAPGASAAEAWPSLIIPYQARATTAMMNTAMKFLMAGLMYRILGYGPDPVQWGKSPKREVTRGGNTKSSCTDTRWARHRRPAGPDPGGGRRHQRG